MKATPLEVMEMPRTLETARSSPEAPVKRDGSSGGLLDLVQAAAGWAWRFVIGPMLCMNYVTAVAVFGWLSRHMQAIIVRSWWSQGRRPRGESFAEYCDSLEPDAPRARAGWFMRDRFWPAIHAPLPGGRAPDFLTKAWRTLGVPIHSLWLNMKLGLKGIFGTFMLVGWGCLLMTFSWLFGWFNSFNKGYEISYLGPLTGVTGLLLFIAAMYYVPMAQAHFALTGEVRSFLDFRFVWKLVRARLFFYTGVIALTGLAFVPLEIMRIIPKYLEQMNAGFNDLPAADYATFLQQYFLFVSIYLFTALFVLRHLAARIYASAVVAVLRRGEVLKSELHPKIAGWLDQLDVDVMPVLPAGGFGEAVLKSGGWFSRRVLFTFIFIVWLLVISLIYVREFLNYHPYVGFLNQALIQIPCVNATPEVPPPLPGPATPP